MEQRRFEEERGLVAIKFYQRRQVLYGKILVMAGSEGDAHRLFDPDRELAGKIFRAGKVFSAESGVKNLMELNLATGDVKKLAVNPANLAVAARGGTVAYFANRDAKDRSGTEGRLVVMKKGGQPAVVVAADKFVDGATKNNGLHGFGNTIALTPDGKRVFISGKDSIGRTERLQMFDGAAIRLFPDASVKPSFLQASDVVVNASFAAFKVGADNNTTLAYIRLK